MTSEERARELIARALEITPEEVLPDAGIGEVLGWDSIGHVNVIGALEDELGRALGVNEVSTLKSVRDVAAILAGSGNPAA